MKVRWLQGAVADVLRLHAFLAPVDREAADRAAQSIRAAPERLLDSPRLGQRIQSYAHGEVRRLKIGRYELRYEISGSEIVVLRVYHERESRPR